MRKILVTGGAGYIGSHVCKALKAAGYEPITFDNFSHGHEWAVRWGPFVYGDLQNASDLDAVFSEFRPEGVIHLAGSIHLRESIETPHKHYYNNVTGSLSLLKAMEKHRVTTLVFSSSAAVYAPPDTLPIKEDARKEPVNPYGKTKWMTEQIFEDFHHAHGLNAVSLRYFNAAGASAEGEIGEAHTPETHLIPSLILTAQGKREEFTLYSNQLPTPDGSAIRDYIHVTDLGSAHVKALEWLQEHRRPEAFNLGTGRGYSVLEVVQQVEEVSGLSIPIQVENQKISELPQLVADPTKAAKMLGFTPSHSSLREIIETAWKWHSSPVLAKL